MKTNVYGEITGFHITDRITPHFTLREMCHGVALWPVEYADRLYRLCGLLEDVRAHVGAPIVVTSGYRSPEHNARTAGAAKHSPHMRGYAADFRAGGDHGEADTIEAHKFLLANRETWKLCGLGWYPLLDKRGKPVIEATGMERSHSRIHADLRHLPFRSWTL